MRKTMIAGNWKMYKTVEETLAFINSFQDQVKNLHGIDLVIAPPFPALYEASLKLKGSKVGLAAQNAHWELEGAYTVEVSPRMLKESGCQYVIIGHSERRKYFKETDEELNRKIKSALSQGLMVIFCLGETLEEREKGETFSIIERQLKEGLKGLKKLGLEKIVIAYEPVWAIGTGKTATPEQAEEAHKYLRKLIWDNYGMEEAQRMRILYGGSVKPENIAEIINQPNVDGALVGGASLKVDSFVSIIKNSLRKN